MLGSYTNLTFHFLVRLIFATCNAHTVNFSIFTSKSDREHRLRERHKNGAEHIWKVIKKKLGFV